MHSFCVKSINNFFAKHGMIESLNITTKEMRDILNNISNRSH